VEPPKFTPSELAALIAETISWMKEQRENFLPSSIPLNSAVKIQLQPFFTAETLDQLRIAKLSRPGESIPYPPDYEKVRAGGARLRRTPRQLHSLTLRSSIPSRRCELFFTPWSMLRNSQSWGWRESWKATFER
jgi:hypothetical protein